MVDHRDAVAYLLHLAQQVRVEKHRCPACGQPADDLAHVVPANRVEGGCRLVQEHELRLSHQRGAEAQPLLHSLGECADPIVGPLAQSNRLERGSDLVLPARPWQGRQLAVKG